MSEQQENTANDLGDYSLDDEDQLQPEDTLDQRDRWLSRSQDASRRERLT